MLYSSYENSIVTVIGTIYCEQEGVDGTESFDITDIRPEIK